MGLPLTSRTTLATRLLLALPLVVLVVPQGTVQRSLAPETFFVLYLLTTIAVVIGQAALRHPPLTIQHRQAQPMLFLLLTYLILLNPLWSLHQGNDLGRIAITAAPFVMLGTSYLLALARVDARQALQCTQMLAVSGGMLAVLVIANYLLGDRTDPAVRSTMIEGTGTLTLPLLPMAGVQCVAFALAARKPLATLLWGALAATLVLAILMTVTRAMLLALIVGTLLTCFLLLIRAHGGRARMLMLIALGTGTVAAVGAPMASAWLQRINPDSLQDFGTILGRFDEYAAFYSAFLGSPFLGNGLGFLATFPSEFDETLRNVGITVCHSHLFFFAGATGILGMLLYYGTIADGLLRLLRATRTLGDRQHAMGAVAGLVGSGVAGIVFTLSSTTFTTLSYNVYLGALLYCARVDWRTA